MTQEAALSILKTGANVFLTGEPGSGKTHTINRYIEYLRDHGVEPAVTASTGIAATHIGGMTIHSFCGIGIKRSLSEYDIEELTQIERLVKRAQNTTILIIEEISMLDARVVDMVDMALRALKQDSRPFGGVQVIFVGDFYQLPPVGKRESTLFAFNARAWSNAKPVTCYLHEQHRQEDDVFLDILSSVRGVCVEHKHYRLLADRTKKEHETENVVATKLYSHNEDVDLMNARKLESLPDKKRQYETSGKGSRTLVEQLKRGCLSPEVLELKKDAVVMFTKNNFEKGYVNGTIGTVIDFGAEGWPVVEIQSGEEIHVEPQDWNIEENGKIRATITQLPLRLAWAITVHKSQGMSLDAAVIDLRRAFEYGQGYVALSRVRTLEGLHLLGLNERALEVHPEIRQRDSWFRAHSEAIQNRFNELGFNELNEMHRNFLTAVGGSLEGGHKKKKRKLLGGADTYEETKELVLSKKTLEEIARRRKKALTTIFGHIEKLHKEKRLSTADVEYLWHAEDKNVDDLEHICEAFQKLDTDRLTPVFKHLKERFSFNDLRLARILSSGKIKEKKK